MYWKVFLPDWLTNWSPSRLILGEKRLFSFLSLSPAWGHFAQFGFSEGRFSARPPTKTIPQRAKRASGGSKGGSAPLAPAAKKNLKITHQTIPNHTKPNQTKQTPPQKKINSQGNKKLTYWLTDLLSDRTIIWQTDRPTDWLTDRLKPF